MIDARNKKKMLQKTHQNLRIPSQVSNEKKNVFVQVQHIDN